MVKPAISASAHNTRLMDGTTLSAEHEVVQRMQGQPFLVQQFIPEIHKQGEISFIISTAGSVMQHSSVPLPATSACSRNTAVRPSCFFHQRRLLEQANQIAVSVPQVRESLDRRIDAVARNGKLILMELELIEPELFLGLAEGAAERFAKAIARRMRPETKNPNQRLSGTTTRPTPPEGSP